MTANGNYFYFFPNRSFGFSPEKAISLGSADTFNISDPLRLSWHLDINTGGWRLGSINGLNSSTAYSRIIFSK